MQTNKWRETFPPSEDGNSLYTATKKNKAGTYANENPFFFQERKEDSNNRDRVKGKLVEDCDTKRW